MFIICIKPSDATSALLQDRNREFVMFYFEVYYSSSLKLQITVFVEEFHSVYHSYRIC